MTLCQKKSSGFATFLMKVMTEAGFYGGPRCLEDLKGEGTSLACHGLSHSFLFRYNTPLPGPYSEFGSIMLHPSIRMFQVQLRSHVFPLQPGGFSSTPSAPSFVVVQADTLVTEGCWFPLYFFLYIKLAVVLFILTDQELNHYMRNYMGSFSNQEQHIMTNFLRGPENAPNPSIYIYIYTYHIALS